jgi:ABC-type multidrug transport system fused ATPase/permease subunit
VVLISHRLANVVESECLYVMEGGCLAECGNHEKLLENRHVYHRLYEKQHTLESDVRR